MFIRAYLRASTKEQNAERARESLIQFAAQHGQRIAAFYIENVSGATLQTPSYCFTGTSYQLAGFATT